MCTPIYTYVHMYLYKSFVFVRVCLSICVCVCPSLQEAADKVRGANFEENDPKKNPQVSFSPSLLLAHKHKTHKTQTSVNTHIISPWLFQICN